MHITTVPLIDLKVVATGWGPELLLAALEEILYPAKVFPHYTIIQDGPSSMRMFLQEPFGDSIEMPDDMILPSDITRSVVKFMKEEGRYPDVQPPGTQKGFSVGVVEIVGKKAAIVTAAWV